MGQRANIRSSVVVARSSDCAMGADTPYAGQATSGATLMNDQTTSPPATPIVKNRVAPAKLVKWGIAAIVLLVGIGFAVHYWRLAQLYVSTDNAYVNANRIELAAQASGPVTRIWVEDQQPVKRGEVLFEIDAQPYQLAVDAAEAQLDLAYQGTSQDRAAVAAARAQVTQ